MPSENSLLLILSVTLLASHVCRLLIPKYLLDAGLLLYAWPAGLEENIEESKSYFCAVNRMPLSDFLFLLFQGYPTVGSAVHVGHPAPWALPVLMEYPTLWALLGMFWCQKALRRGRLTNEGDFALLAGKLAGRMPVRLQGSV